MIQAQKWEWRPPAIFIVVIGQSLASDAAVVDDVITIGIRPRPFWLSVFLSQQFLGFGDYGRIHGRLRTPRSYDKMTGEDRTLIEILEEGVPVNLAKYVDYVASPQAGAIATFSGTTRDMFEGKTVLELRYEAYVPMAVRCVESACKSARSTWSLMSIAVAHRLGPVPVGETSVFVAVSAVHRTDALDACKFLIDEIKASVPIWKKEVYTDGEVWKENKEFLERIPDLGKGARSGNGSSENDVSAEKGHKRSCCGAKVRLDEEDSDSNHL